MSDLEIQQLNEHDEQVAVIEYSRYIGIRLVAIPNGGLRNKFVAVKLKAEGVTPGVPDLFLPEAHGGFHGLWIEMKAGRKKPTPEQTDWIEYLRKQGYKAEVCWGADNAITVISDYLRDGA